MSYYSGSVSSSNSYADFINFRMVCFTIFDKTFDLSLDSLNVESILFTVEKKQYKFNLKFLKQVIPILDEVKDVKIDE